MERSLGVLLLTVFSYVSCTGYLEIRLQSNSRQPATITVSQGANQTLLTIPIGLQIDSARKLGAFPIDFAEHYTLSIIGGRVEKLGINESHYTAEFQPARGTLSPKQLYLPVNGLQLMFECDEKFTGSKCDVPCSSDCDTGRQNQTLTISTDYTIDMTQLPEIVRRLKETTKVDNEIEKKKVEAVDDLKRRTQDKDVLGATKPRENPLTSLFSGILDRVMKLRDDISKETGSGKSPIRIKVKVDNHSESDEDSGKDSTEKKESDDDSDIPIEKEHKGPFSISDVMEDAMTIMHLQKKAKEEKDHSEEIDKHSSIQKMMGFGGGRKPSSGFSIMDGPAAMLMGGMGGNPFMGPLMGMLPRFTRHTEGKEPGAPIAAGRGAPKDFELDQIIS